MWGVFLALLLSSHNIIPPLQHPVAILCKSICIIPYWWQIYIVMYMVWRNKISSIKIWNFSHRAQPYTLPNSLNLLSGALGKPRRAARAWALNCFPLRVYGLYLLASNTLNIVFSSSHGSARRRCKFKVLFSVQTFAAALKVHSMS